MDYTRSQIYTVLLLYITILPSVCHGRLSQQKFAGPAASLTLPSRVLQKGVPAQHLSSARRASRTAKEWSITFMEDNSPRISFSRVNRPLADDIESQHGHSDSYDDIDDNLAPQAPDAYPIYDYPTGDQDRLFTVVPTQDPNEYIEHEHDPILQPRGAHTKTIQAQYEEAARRAANAGPQNLQTVPLFKGNLVMDCPIAPRLLNQIPHAQPPERDEFTHVRYSAVTVDPLEFREQGYVLRSHLFAKPRKTELLVAVTMYNEDEVLLGRTLKAVMKNVEHLCSRASSKIWGKEAWKKIVICIISDGRSKIHPKSLALLAGLGVYQEGVAKSQVNGKNVVAHLYEVGSSRGMHCEAKWNFSIPHNAASRSRGIELQ